MNTTVEELLSQKERKFNAKELALLAAYFRSVMFDTLHTRGTGHWGGAASSAELTTCLYFNRLTIKSDDPQWEDRDRVVLSKGHASINLYTMLAHRGFFPIEELSTFRTLNTRLQGHPCMKTLLVWICPQEHWVMDFPSGWEWLWLHGSQESNTGPM